MHCEAQQIKQLLLLQYYNLHWLLSLIKIVLGKQIDWCKNDFFYQFLTIYVLLFDSKIVAIVPQKKARVCSHQFHIYHKKYI